MENTPTTTKGSQHKKVNGYSSVTLHAKKDRKRAEAKDRQIKHDKLTLPQKLAKAKSNRGNSKREVSHLTNKMEEAKKAVKS